MAEGVATLLLNYKSAELSLACLQGLRSATGVENPVLLMDNGSGPSEQAILTAGVEGVEHEYPSMPPAESDVTLMTDEERAAHGIVKLPGSLLEALELAERSDVLRRALGAQTYQSLLRNKRIEWDRFRAAVTDYELKRYLPTL